MKPAAGSEGEAGQARLPWTSWGTSPWWYTRPTSHVTCVRIVAIREPTFCAGRAALDLAGCEQR